MKRKVWKRMDSGSGSDKDDDKEDGGKYAKGCKRIHVYQCVNHHFILMSIEF